MTNETARAFARLRSAPPPAAIMRAWWRVRRWVDDHLLEREWKLDDYGEPYYYDFGFDERVFAKHWCDVPRHWRVKLWPPHGVPPVLDGEDA